MKNRTAKTQRSPLYRGEDDELGGAHMASSLRAHVAPEMAREAAILKERRKAQEAKESCGKPKGSRKGDHKNDGE